ncbi:MAG: cytochrome c5 family protein [Pseudohongiellaceae bacterium]
MKTIILPALLSLFLTACLTGESDIPAPRTQQVLAAPAAAVDEDLLGKWARSCALCHITGEAGAPITGDTAEWQRRLQKGEDAILDNVLYGYNSMPPLGYCMACEIPDFRAMIAYMAGAAP